MFSPEVIAQLEKPIDPARVKSRDGGRGKSLSYIAGEDAIATANRIFGIGGWGYEVVTLECLGEEPVKRDDREGYRVAYGAVVKVVVQKPALAGEEIPFVEFSDTGYGDGLEYSGSRLTPHELARKEAVTDALKRALKNFGDQFGLSLYSEEGRREVDAARKAAEALPALKRSVAQLAADKLNKAKPTAAEIAELFGVKTTDLQKTDVLMKIINEGGV